MSDPALVATALAKSYALGGTRVEVLAGVDLSVRQGEFVAVMGPSGSGKSTLLYLLAGLERPTSGTVLVKGQDLARLSDRKGSRFRLREIGFVFQFDNLIPNLNVQENVLVPALLAGRTGMGGRADELLDAVGLLSRRRHTPRDLSGGEQQRAAIARALINDPGLVLADEPTGNLDTRPSQEILGLLSRTSREHGKTIVMVTHSPEAASCCDRVIHVRDGKVS